MDNNNLSPQNILIFKDNGMSGKFIASHIEQVNKNGKTKIVSERKELTSFLIKEKDGFLFYISSNIHYNFLKEIRRVKKLNTNVKIIVVGQTDNAEIIIHCTQKECQGWIMPSDEDTAIANSMSELINKSNIPYHSPETSKTIATFFQDYHSIKTPNEDIVLDKMDKKILKFTCQGKSAAEIADKLSISPRTVEHHRERIYIKFGAKNLSELIIKANRMGFKF